MNYEASLVALSREVWGATSDSKIYGLLFPTGGQWYLCRGMNARRIKHFRGERGSFICRLVGPGS